MGEPLKLNLGSGQNPLPGYVNVDKFGSPQVCWDLEVFPWPWPDGSVQEVVLNHVLEHLGAAAGTYIRVLKELYRVCIGGAQIHINVPHPRHDDFLNDPTHVRAVTPDGLALFSKKFNRQWAQQGCANSPLALYHDVDFNLARVNYVLDQPWLDKLNRDELSNEAVFQALRLHNNVAKEIQILLEVIKETPQTPA